MYENVKKVSTAMPSNNSIVDPSTIIGVCDSISSGELYLI